MNDAPKIPYKVRRLADCGEAPFMKMALKTENKNFTSSQTEVPLSEIDQQKHILLFSVSGIKGLEKDKE